MNALTQTIFAFAIVAIATSYAVVKFMPKAWRLQVASRVADLAMRIGLSASTARRVEAKLSSGGACGSCDTCKSCATPADAKGAEAFATPAPSRFRQIPIRRA